VNLLQRLSREERSISVADYLGQAFETYMVNGNAYPITSYGQGGTEKPIPNGNAGLYKQNPVLFSVVQTRLSLFSEARFQWQQLRAGRPGDLFGNETLDVLERPWLNGTTGDLLARMEQRVSTEGNFYGVIRDRQIKSLNPLWVDVLRGTRGGDAEDDKNELTAELLGYAYHPGGTPSLNSAILLPDEVAHFAPIPDPDAMHRGMAWISPLIREVAADNAATAHKAAFWRNAATPNMVIKFAPDVNEQKAEAWKRVMESDHVGAFNAYSNLYVGGGADVTVVGADFKQMDFNNVTGRGETRIAAAGGVPPVIVGLSEGLQAATYSNYAQARRRFADGWARPQWRSAAGALESILPTPPGSRLWYDDRDIPFLQEDQKDAAEIQGQQASTIRQLTDAGFTPESAVDAVLNADFSRLVHTGLYSVQLTPPGTDMTPPAQGVPV